MPKPSANVRHTKPTATRRLLSNECSRMGGCSDAGGGAGDRRGTAASDRPRGARTAPKPYDLSLGTGTQNHPKHKATKAHFACHEPRTPIDAPGTGQQIFPPPLLSLDQNGQCENF
ncbi:hypothetical protein B5X24_HaOG207699 [Helicoverpa armigera]|uniref:Uncharacterized protein n=1 Tax=Helicoverpa armigera TaxID=29058 RepID=A0A2W1BHK6_HELAM|nr:hypothetical protein B5X24_HaOG216425 [Helicoverpa armigera]PZC74532.1 hypothetical protein B5X24_HaOG207699 [Helicoverpa armigera]